MSVPFDEPPGSAALGVGRLGVDAALGLIAVVEAMHGTIARRPLALGGASETRTRGIPRLVYQSIRAVTGAVGGGLDWLLPRIAPAAGDGVASPGRDALLSVLNGVVGDHLAATGNPLAIETAFRRDGRAVAADPAALAALGPGRRLLVLVHGLCMSDRQWQRNGHDHGEALAGALDLTPLYLRYNSGRHVSTSGRDLADRLEALTRAWPGPLDEIILLGHSMGGLVARSAVHHAREAGHRWPERLSSLVCLGTPHHGAPLERAGNLLEGAVAVSPYARPIARLGGVRSAGITDLRFGNLLDGDWAARHPRHRHDPRTPVPLPDGVACFAVAATRGRRAGDVADRLIGDGIVPVASALGRHPDPRFALAFPPARQLVVPEASHFDLVSSPAVFDQLVAWLG
jgi:pimeloyl-ACP methyl ester carboxylesterase